MTHLPGQHALDHQILHERDGRWRLMGSRCPRCGTTAYPPRRLCPSDLETCTPCELSDVGVVYEAVRIDMAPVGFEGPYWVGYVDLPEGVRIFAPFDWPVDEPPRHGLPVRYEVRTVRTEPESVLGPVFVPA